MSIRNLINLLIVLILLIVITGCQRPEKQKSAQTQVISLSPHITEIVYALDGQEQLIAVSDFCHYPAGALLKEKIGGLLNPNIEKIVSLTPTLLLGVPAHEKLNTELNKFGLSIVMLPNENVHDVLATIDSIGILLDRELKARELSAKLQNELKELATKKRQKKPAGMLVIGRESGSLRNITVAGKDTFIDEMWRIAGGINIFDDLPNRYASVNIETILTRDPEVIIEFVGEESSAITEGGKDQAWLYLKNVTAVKSNHVFTIAGNHALIPGPRLTLLAKDFSDIIDEVYYK